MSSYDDDEDEINIMEEVMDNINTSNIQDIIDSVLQITEKNQSSNQQIRNDLINYLDQIDKKVGSDGELLVKIPSNFNMIAESMNRSDLMGNNSPSLTSDGSNKPWSQYLLFDSLTAEQNDTEYQGRYKYAFNDENVSDDDDYSNKKIKKGLAQIELLDRQLHEVTKRNSSIVSKPMSVAITKMTPSRSDRTASIINRTTNYVNVEDTTPKSRSINIHCYHNEPPNITVEDDLTFLTTKRTRKEKHNYSPVYQFTQQYLDDAYHYNHYDEIDDNENINNSYETKFTSDQTTTRLDYLLRGGTGGEDYANDSDNVAIELLCHSSSDLEPFIDNETRIANHEIDEKLAIYGRMHRLNSIINDNNDCDYHIKDKKEFLHNQQFNNNTKVKVNKKDSNDENKTTTNAIFHLNYLKEQRLNRKQKLYADKIEKLLEKCVKEPLKFSNNADNALLTLTSSSSSKVMKSDDGEDDEVISGRHYCHSSISIGSSNKRKKPPDVTKGGDNNSIDNAAMVPVFADVLEKYSIGGSSSQPINLNDIKLLIQNIKAMTDHNNTTHTTNNDESMQVDKEQINKLLSNYKNDINKLQIKKILSSSAVASRSSVSGSRNQNNDDSTSDYPPNSSSGVGGGTRTVTEATTTTGVTQQQSFFFSPPSSLIIINNNNNNSSSTSHSSATTVQVSDNITICIEENNNSSTTVSQQQPQPPDQKKKIFDLYEDVPPCRINANHPAVLMNSSSYINSNKISHLDQEEEEVTNNNVATTSLFNQSVTTKTREKILRNMNNSHLNRSSRSTVNSNNKTDYNLISKIEVDNLAIELDNNTDRGIECTNSITSSIVSLRDNTSTNYMKSHDNLKTYRKSIRFNSSPHIILNNLNVSDDCSDHHHLLNNNTIFKNPNHHQVLQMKNIKKKEKQVNNILNTTTSTTCMTPTDVVEDGSRGVNKLTTLPQQCSYNQNNNNSMYI